MPNPHALVDFVSPESSLEPTALRGGSGTRFVTIPFRGGRFGRLDLSRPHAAVWAGVLESARQSASPVYVEVDPATSELTVLLIPLVVGIERISPAGDDLEVELVISQAKHYLRRSHPDFDALLALLEQARATKAMVAVTETEAHDIIDVRLLGGQSVTAFEPSPEALSEADPGVAVTPGQAQQMFALASQTVCCPGSAAAPCIPFNYPDDGCWARAHEMCRLMIAAGILPNKVWIFGSLRAASQNNPDCQVLWGWHVAPTLSVGAETYVIDPALFNGPVTQATWAGVQGDPNPTLIPSPASTYWRNRDASSAITDPTYARTNTDLTTYRNRLRVRGTSPAGPPPYTACIAARPGVQFIGLVAGGETRRWFTFNWPAAWHVVWTVMPITTCAGAPQLTWKTQVERASAGAATYWIVVTNLTSNAIRFEGRYDVLSR